MKLSMKSIGSIVINGHNYSGKNIQISGNKVTIDGVAQSGDFDKEINITVTGNVDYLENDVGTVTVNYVGSIKTLSGDVKCGNVDGSVNTMSGDVICKSVNGSVNTMSGDITHS